MRSNVDLHRRAVEAFNRHDADAAAALGDPEIEFHSPMTTPGGEVYRGRDGVRRWFRDLEEVWGEELRLEPEADFDVGEQTMSFHVLRGRGRQSGAQVAMPGAAVARWQNGLAVYWRIYASREDALTDLGVSQDALEPIDP
jgi:ketosteroid isomerase-like protein